MQERREPTPEIVREEVFYLKPVNDPQKCEVTMLRAYKNKNLKKDPAT